MSDSIYREDAIKAVWGDDINPSEEGMVFEAQSHIDRDIRLIPSADRPQGWIPCSERLPREEEQDDELGVLVTLGNGYSGLQYDYYYNGHWADWNRYVIAWMPLPEPWKGADDDLGRSKGE